MSLLWIYFGAGFIAGLINLKHEPDLTEDRFLILLWLLSSTIFAPAGVVLAIHNIIKHA